jgi:hypothetical protein
MMVNSIKKNASFVFPRLGLLVVLLWLLWFMNSVIQNTWMVLLKQVRRALGCCWLDCLPCMWLPVASALGFGKVAMASGVMPSHMAVYKHRTPATHRCHSLEVKVVTHLTNCDCLLCCGCVVPQGRIDARTMSGARMITECSSLLLAGVLVLSALGININALLLPTGVVLAIASKDLLQNLIAGMCRGCRQHACCPPAAAAMPP